MAVVSYQNNDLPLTSPRAILSYGPEPPETGGLSPDDVDVKASAKMMAGLVDPSVPVLQLDVGDGSKFDWRPAGGNMSEDPSKFVIRGFVRSKRPLSTESRFI
jgi:hypothetical protein